MSTDELRRAAAKVRELAEAARDESGRDASDFEEYALSKVLGRMPAVAAYIAAMQPAVGLAVADWLEHMAELGCRNIRPDLYLTGWAQAVTVARQILGDQP